MLVHRQGVEAQRFAVLELVQIAVIEPVALLGIEVLIRKIYPHRAVAAARLEIELGIGHEMKENEVHAEAPLANRVTSSQNSSGVSACGRWPAPLTIATSAFGKSCR